MQPRVLVLEDEPLIAMLLCDWLAEMGCEIMGPARTVADALDLVRAQKPAGAILDVSVGGGDCRPVADHLQHQGVPFAFATGHAACRLTAGYAQAALLAKPYDYATLQGVVTRMLSHHQAAQ